MLLENFLLSISVVTPIFVFLCVGLITRHFKWLSAESVSDMNKFIFKIFFPVVLFNNIYHASLEDVVNGSFLLFIVISTFCVFITLWTVATPLIKNVARRGAFVQGTFRHNSLLFSLPIVTSMYGASQTGLVSVALSIIVPIYNILVVILLETLRSGSFKLNKIINSLTKNPLIIASAVGLIFLVFNLNLPKPLENVSKSIASSATPIALMMLGASLDFAQLKKNKNMLIIATFTKLIITPGLFIISAIMLGFRGLELGTILAMTAAPTAVTSFSMAQVMGADGELAGQLIVITSALSVLTLFLWIFTLSTFGLLF